MSDRDANDDWAWMLWPRGLFETRRHARRRFEEFQARFDAKYEVTTVNGERVATLRSAGHSITAIDRPACNDNAKGN